MRKIPNRSPNVSGTAFMALLAIGGICWLFVTLVQYAFIIAAIAIPIYGVHRLIKYLGGKKNGNGKH